MITATSTPSSGLTIPATIVVTNTNDSGAGSLRNAIASASAGDTITFAAALSNQTINLTTGQINLTKNITINGSGANGLTISGNNVTRIFDLTGLGINVNINNLTIANGRATTGTGENRAGGAIRGTNNTVLNIENTTFLNNVAGFGGAIYTGFSSTNKVTNSTFDNNNGSIDGSERGGGAIATKSNSSLTVTGSTFKNNQGTNGGAINSLLGALTIENSTFLNNNTTQGSGVNTNGYGGAVYTDGANASGPNSTPGSVGGTIAIRNSSFDGNTGKGQGGGLFLFMYPPDQLIMENSTITNNRVIRAANGDALGGGIRIGNGAYSITNTTVANNIAEAQGGGLWVGEKGSGTIVNSTFWQNKAINPSNTQDGLGGGLLFATTSAQQITNVTIASNQAGGEGGGIVGGQNITLKNTIVANNAGNNPFGNKQNASDGKGFNSNPSPYFTDGGNNLQWPAITNNFNNANITATVIQADPKLGTLQDNGNGRFIVPLLTGSAAIDRGNNNGAPTTDQRGQARPIDGDNNGTAIVDLGAYEFTNSNLFSPPTLAIAPTSATKNEGNSGTTPFAFTVTRSGDTSTASSASFAVTGSGTNPANAADFGTNLPTGTVSFAANETTKTITVNVIGDSIFETNETFNVTLSNPVGAILSTATATVTITNDDADPVFAITDNDVATNALAENATNGSTVGITANATDADGSNNIVTYALTDNASGRFAIDASTGVVTVANATLLNFEAATSHNITIKATSAHTSESTQTFAIAVSDVDEFDVITPTDSNVATNAIAENAANGSTVGITANATDADGSNNTVTYTLTDNASGRFAVNSTTGVVTVANGSLLNFEGATAHNITIKATSADTSESTQTFAIAVSDVDEFDVITPTDSNVATNTIAENATNDSTVGIIANATDADGSNNTVTYSLIDNTGGRFAVNSTTGVVTVANGSLLNFEAATSHNIIVQATSSDGSNNTQTFAIAVSDVNETPTLANAIADQNVKQGAAFNFILPVNTFNDVDAGDIINYQASLENGAALPNWLSFNPTTTAFTGTPNNSDVVNLNIKVTATDKSNLTVSDTFALEIENVNDAPTLAKAIADQTTIEDKDYIFTFDPNTFSDIDKDDILTYSAALKNGNELPAWLKFNAIDRTFSGKPTKSDLGSLEIAVLAKDKAGESVTAPFLLNVKASLSSLRIETIGANSDIFQVFNNKGDPKLKVILNSQGDNVVNELGFFTVDDAQGRINGIAPDDADYTQAALSRSKAIFSAIAKLPDGFNNNDLSSILKLDSGSDVRFYLVRNGSLDGVISGSVPLSNLLFSDPLKQQVEQTNPNKIILSWKSVSSNSANFQDLIVTIQSTDEEGAIGANLQGNPQGEVIDLHTATTPLTATFTVNREAAFNNFIGFYRIADEKGGIDTNGDGISDVLVGQSGYIQAAINGRAEGIGLTVANQGTATYTGTFQPGSIFAPFIISNGTIEALLDSNPNNNPEVYFPFLGSNSDKQDHIRMLGNNVFAFEDLPDGGDNDFNDMIVRVSLRSA